MTRPDAVVFYDTSTNAITRIVICDNAKQMTDPKGPCVQAPGEAKFVIQRSAYESLTDSAEIVAAIISVAESKL